MKIRALLSFDTETGLKIFTYDFWVFIKALISLLAKPCLLKLLTNYWAGFGLLWVSGCLMQIVTEISFGTKSTRNIVLAWNSFRKVVKKSAIWSIAYGMHVFLANVIFCSKLGIILDLIYVFLFHHMFHASVLLIHTYY